MNPSTVQVCVVLGIVILTTTFDSVQSKFSKAPSYNSKYGFNVSLPGLLNNHQYSVQQDGPNWHIRIGGSSRELSYDPDRIHNTPEQNAALDDSSEPSYIISRTLRDGDQIVAANGIPLASHNFRQALEVPDFYDATIKSLNRNMLFPVFERQGQRHNVIQGYVQVQYFSAQDLTMQLHPATEEARVAERTGRVQEEQERQAFLIAERKAAMQAMRKAEEDYNYFELTMGKDKKQELLFDPKAFPLKLTKQVQYLRKGDELTSVNGMSVLEGDLISAFTILKTADYPKVLRWRRYIDAEEDINLQLGSLQITSPKAARACFPFRMAKFGEIPTCEPSPLRFVRDSCKIPKGPGFNGSLILGFRGKDCSFEQRIRNFQEIQAAGGIIGNTEDPLIQMIAKEGDDIEIPAVLIGLENAVVLRRIMQLMEKGSAGTYATARIGDGLICGYDDPCPSLTKDEVEIYADAATKKRESAGRRRANRFLPDKIKPKEKERTINGRRFVKPAVDVGTSGTMHFWNGESESSFKYEIAKFGLEVPSTPQQVLWGNDRLMVISEGCKTSGMEKLASFRKFERVWVIFARGTCSYTVKTKVAQSIGAAGLIVVNNVNKLMRMPFSEGEDLSNIEISAVMISKKSGDKLMKLLSTSETEPSIIRFEVSKKVKSKGKVSRKAKKREY